MRKLLSLAALCSVLLACSSKDEPVETYDVKFSVNGWNAMSETMSAPRKAPATLNDGENDLTDLYLFDGSTQLAHQTNDATDFGTITVQLTTGDHHLHFVATRSGGLSYDGGVLTATNLRSTFGKHYDLTVSGSSEEAVILERLSGKLIITVQDVIPSSAQTLQIQIGDYYAALNVTTFAGVRTGAFDQTVNISGKQGQSNVSWTLNILAPSADEYNTTYTITARDGSNNIIGQAMGQVPLSRNTKTILRGNLFSGTKSFISLSTEWNEDIEVAM